jgi:hypothetical protein
MSKVIEFTGQASKKDYFEGSDQPQALIFKNIDVNAKVKLTKVSGTGNDVKVCPSLKLGFLYEFTRKVRSILTGKPHSYRIDTIAVGQFGFKSATIPVGVGGEVLLGRNDQFQFELLDLEPTALSSVTSIGGLQVADRPIQVLEDTYDKKNTDQHVDVSKVDFIAFDTIPEQVNLHVENDIIRHTPDTIKAYNVDRFGFVTEHVDEGEFYYGAYFCNVLDVRGLQKIVLEDTTNTDIKFYTLKL